MAFNYRLPQITADSVTILNTPVAGDTALANGVLTIKDEGGNPSLVVKAADLLSFTYAANNAGTANVKTVVLTGITLLADTNYVLTVHAPYLINFFGGGQETGAIYQTRTYTLGFGPATPTVDGIGAAFAARINADNNACFTASYNSSSDTLSITADSAFAGSLEVTAPLGAVVADGTAWVSPVGANAEVVAYAGNNPYATAAAYNRYIVRYRKMVRHSAVTGLQVIKPVNALVYLDVADSGTAAAVTLLTSILNGSYGTSYATLAKYCGCPAV
jgi:hypothetical protein